MTMTSKGLLKALNQTWRQQEDSGCQIPSPLPPPSPTARNLGLSPSPFFGPLALLPRPSSPEQERLLVLLWVDLGFYGSCNLWHFGSPNRRKRIKSIYLKLWKKLCFRIKKKSQQITNLKKLTTPPTSQNPENVLLKWNAWHSSITLLSYIF